MVETTPGAATWRLAQARRRRRRLTPRGLVTLLLAGAVLSAVAWSPAPEAALESVPPPAPQPVSAQPPSPQPAAPAPVPRSAAAPAELLARLPSTRSVLELDALRPPGVSSGKVGETGVFGRVVETVPARGAGAPGPLQVEYTLDAGLTREVHRALQHGRVELGHVILLEPDTGRVLAYASTDTERFPATRAYPAASLVKVITAAAALDTSPDAARLPCRFSGSPYRLTPARIDPPRAGTLVTLRKALATSNNQCFAQLAVHAVGARPLVEAIQRFGWTDAPAPAHAAGSVDAGDDRFDVAKLGCGLAGSRITPLHAAQLAASLAHGELLAPRWIDRIVDGEGRELPLPSFASPRRVMPYELAAHLREMLTDTTTRGTARRAFRHRNGQPRLGTIRVAGKTGSLSGTNPRGRYEWFVGLAPAEAPKLAIATVVVHGDRWWRNASQLAADVLERAFCQGGRCRAENVERLAGSAAATARLGGPAPLPSG